MPQCTVFIPMVLRVINHRSQTRHLFPRFHWPSWCSGLIGNLTELYPHVLMWVPCMEAEFHLHQRVDTW